MNKADLIKTIAGDADLTKAQATAALDAFIDGVTKSLKAGEGVTLVGFGSFSVAKREARQGRNPRTGEPMTIKASKTVKFKPGKGFDLN